ncbi:MAG: NfeD family protein [Thermoleophilaceae bacterium]
MLAVGEMLSLVVLHGSDRRRRGGSRPARRLSAGGGLAIQIIVFILASIASLGVLRPIARQPPARSRAQLRTGTQALVGAYAEVLEPVERPQRSGQARRRGLVGTRVRRRRGTSSPERGYT